MHPSLLCHVSSSCKLLKTSAVPSWAAQGSAVPRYCFRCSSSPMAGWGSLIWAAALQSLVSTTQSMARQLAGSLTNLFLHKRCPISHFQLWISLRGAPRELACPQGCLGRLRDAAAASSCPSGALLPFAFCRCAGLSRFLPWINRAKQSRLGSAEA